MREIRELANKLSETGEKLKKDHDIEGAVKKLQQIKSKLNNIIKERSAVKR